MKVIKNEESNFQKFIACKDETLNLNKSLSSSTSNNSFDQTIDSVISKMQDCQKIGDIVKTEAKDVATGSDIIEAVEISQKRMELDQKMLIQVKNKDAAEVKDVNSQTAKEFKAIQLANGYVSQAEEIAWTKISISQKSLQQSSVDSINLYNIAAIIFIIYFIIFMYKKKKV